jgi:transcription-repair coupling factor (superfamily II helicase)
MPTDPSQPLHWAGLVGIHQGMAITEAILHATRPILVIAPNSQTALQLLDEWHDFSNHSEALLYFPGLEILPYDAFSSHPDIISRRLTVLNQLALQQTHAVLVTVDTLLYQLSPPSFLHRYSFMLKVGDKLEMEHVRTRLTQAGYHLTSQVREHGEFALRGSIIDLFPMGSHQPFRIDLLDNEIESIGIFSPETQCTLSKITHINLLPGKEFPLNEEAIAQFRTAFRDQFGGNPLNSPIYQDISEGISPAGIESYLPLFFTEMATLFDYLPTDCTILMVDDVAQAAHQFWQDIEARYEQRRHNITRPLPPPETVFIHPEKLMEKIRTYPRITVGTAAPKGSQLIHFDTASLPPMITEAEIAQRRVTQRRLRKTPSQRADLIIRNLTELQIGDPVVHIQHGIGRYQGLETLTVANETAEYMMLLYQDGDKLFVPVTSLNLISRYTGADAEQAPLHKLGTEQWQKAKQAANKKIQDVAAELLGLYADRAVSKGYAYTVDEAQYVQFAEQFPFEETPDQQQAIAHIRQDLMSDKPMDRVICGDVGFGKTEVAMRAAFLAVQNQRQVVVLVPTTLLAQQHFKNFQDRFEKFPITIDVISRFRTKREQDAILARLAEGKIDILIGTHKLLQHNLQCKALGLVIIDEEHRFGVKQKEKLRHLRTAVDILTMTATPIPRTLNMSLSGIRDLSIIATPPPHRVSIKTFIHESQNSLIQEAIQRELLRGGQVYFLHNDISTIHQQAEKLSQLVKEARIGVAHGQMHERDLEDIMSDFYHQRLNVLVCTTIIESGIDIPTANTIIINRADHFGIAQLHQLRGRVGRSHHQAYAYLFIPSRKLMTADAIRRLDAIAQYDQLGIGFTLAIHDLEIRGAGELLGEEQSGSMREVGFSLYMELLNRAIASLKSGKPIDTDLNAIQPTVEVNLHLTALIPAPYLNDIPLRLQFYKRISHAQSSEELQHIQVEMIDRFGLLPEPLKMLFELSELKLKVIPLGVVKLEANAEWGWFEFNDQPKINTEKLIKLIKQSPSEYKLEGGKRLRIKLQKHEPKSRITLIEQILTTIQ